MKPELVAALTALANLDAARIYAHAVHADLLAHGSNGLFHEPNFQTGYETELRVWVDAELSHAKR